MDRVVWVHIYRNSPLLRPPGPFPYQSSRDLAVALLQSEKLDASWSLATSDLEIRGLSPVHRRVLSESVEVTSPVCLLLGRWLLVGGKLGLQAYDLDAGDACWHLPAGQISRTRRTSQMAAAVYTNDAGVQSAFVAVYSASVKFACVSSAILRLSAYSILSDKYIGRYFPTQAFSGKYHSSTSLGRVRQWHRMAIHWTFKATFSC